MRGLWRRGREGGTRGLAEMSEAGGSQDGYKLRTYVMKSRPMYAAGQEAYLR